MAHVSAVDSDHEGPNDDTSENPKTIPTASANAKKQSPEADDKPEEEDQGSGDGDSEDAEESEYEIEAILDAKRGTFPGGRMGYFVKWKGYGPDQNSWVDEKDSENAADLIAEYWKRHKKEKRTNQRKSLDSKPSKGGRKSTTGQDKSPEQGSSTKRSRKSQVKADPDQENGEDDDRRAAKKARKSSGATSLSSSSRNARHEIDNEILADDAVIGNMSKYMGVPDWEHLIDRVDTIERADDGNLVVYFQLKNTGERVKEDSRVCAQRFPQLLIAFYESNLRWRSTDEVDSTETS